MHYYDGLSDEEQASVRANWDEQIKARIADLNLEAALIESGRPWAEADAEGRIVIRTAEGAYLSARTTASWVADALPAGRVASADRVITEAISRLIMSHGEIPAAVTEEPTTTGDRKYDVLLATSFAFALMKRGVEPLPWMVSLPALSQEWLWGDDCGASVEYTEYIRARTPEIFLRKGILLRERDLIAP
ncbi:hypothetical protein [Homoserinimonas sp. A520]